MRPNPAILAFSHLRWNFVYQRPQHLLSRLAASHRVLFVEEPMPLEESRSPYWEFLEPAPGVLVCRPHLASRTPGFHDEHISQLRELIAELLDRENLRDYLLWFYTPMALPLAEGLRPRAVIYDCMDELSAFLNPPPQILEREQALLDRADLVFTGGPSLYEAKKDRHSHVYCFPSSVDAKHFAS